MRGRGAHPLGALEEGDQREQQGSLGRGAGARVYRVLWVMVRGLVFVLRAVGAIGGV